MTPKRNTKDARKDKVVIIGGNFAGLSATKQLASLNKDDLDIVLIDPTECFNWTPNVHEVLSGTKPQQGVEIPRQALVEQLGITLIQQTVTSLDTTEKVICLNDGTILDFDACLLACGYHSTPLNNQATGFGFRNASDVARIANALEHALSSANSIEVSIIGGGFTGVEALGELLRKYHTKMPFRVTVFESSDRLVKDLPAEISADIMQMTSSFPVDFRFNTRVTDTTDGQLTLSDGTVHKSDVTIWTTGSAVPPLLSGSDLVDPIQNGIAVDKNLQSRTAPCCFAAGDAANITVSENQSLAKQSYYAMDSGKCAATNIVKWLRQTTLDEFIPRPRPVLLSFGNLNTYMVSGDSVIASPLLAATKEAIYQVNMHKLFSSFPLAARHRGLIDRFALSVQKLWLPELRPASAFRLLMRSRILSYGGVADLKPLMQGIQSTLLD